jgi:hypothetical protein
MLHRSRILFMNTDTLLSETWLIRYKSLFDHTSEFDSRLECTTDCCKIYASSIDWWAKEPNHCVSGSSEMSPEGTTVPFRGHYRWLRLTLTLKRMRFDNITMHQLEAVLARPKTYYFSRSSQSGTIIGLSSSSHKRSTSTGTAWNRMYIQLLQRRSMIWKLFDHTI